MSNNAEIQPPKVPEIVDQVREQQPVAQERPDAKAREAADRLAAEMKAHPENEALYREKAKEALGRLGDAMGERNSLANQGKERTVSGVNEAAGLDVKGAQVENKIGKIDLKNLPFEDAVLLVAFQSIDGTNAVAQNDLGRTTGAAAKGVSRERGSEVS